MPLQVRLAHGFGGAKISGAVLGFPPLVRLVCFRLLFPADCPSGLLPRFIAFWETDGDILPVNKNILL